MDRPRAAAAHRPETVANPTEEPVREPIRDPDLTDPEPASPLGPNKFTDVERTPCDPLAPDACTASEACVVGDLDPLGGGFCITDASGDLGAVLGRCEHLDGCDPGSLCVPSDVHTGCDADTIGCCLAFCDTKAAVPSCAAGESCIPMADAGNLHSAWDGPGAESYSVGVCGTL